MTVFLTKRLTSIFRVGYCESEVIRSGQLVQSPQYDIVGGSDKSSGEVTYVLRKTFIRFMFLSDYYSSES